MKELLEHPAPSMSTEVLIELARDVFGLTGTVSPLDSERDLNAMVETADGRFTIKVANPADAPGALDLEAAILTHIAAVDPELSVPEVVPTLGGDLTASFELADVAYQLRALTFLPGDPVPGGKLPAPLASATGKLLARLQRALRGFFHPTAGRRLVWDARRAGELVGWVAAVPDPATRELVMRVLSEKAARTLPQLAALPSQVIHNDFNRGNLLIDPNSPHELSGILDFGDALHGTLIQDLAVAAAYAALEHPDPLEAACALVAGYCQVSELEAAEVYVLPDLISIRLAQSLAIAAYRAQLHPDNTDYINFDSPEITAGLHLWESLDANEVSAALRQTAGIPSAPLPTRELASRRQQKLWSGLNLSYREPLHLVRGEGVWLFDAAGRRFLDAYNNVVQVGHANRRVVTAAAGQAARLNTNTRYLTGPVVDLAGKLTNLLPGGLEVCFFVNSGSEANDLAWRIARTVTGHRGGIVTANAYHGWTGDIYALSPEERPSSEAPDTVAVMAAPGCEGPDPEDAIQTLVAAGHSPAGLWVDATFSSDGVRVPPAGFLLAAARTVRDHGGLFIADEVQGGLGRVGAGYWGFAVDDLTPDIVTLGKPLGNGYPIGAVVTTRAIANRFADSSYFFSTFGGNPVAAAAASAVLDITAELRLPHRAETVGNHLRAGLTEIMSRTAISAEIRGAGSFTGLDLKHTELADSFVEALKAKGVLVGQTGPTDSVVKIRPPLIFDLDHADQFLTAAAEAVSDIW
ncbi:MAG: aminotransferase class III-fold pyridoxal phosphate-dependent enzyme [Acidimicrobiia bacterium]